MLKIIFNQLWNQRRQNGWIFIELVIVSFFLWTVVDPIYVLTANGAIDAGYNGKGVYVIEMGHYDASHTNYNKDLDADALYVGQYDKIVRTVRECPEVESISISTSASFPNSPSWNGGQYYNDTTMVHAQHYTFIQKEGSDLFRTYGMKDALTGKEIVLPIDCAIRKGVFISERLAQLLFGQTNVKGEKVSLSDKQSFEIMGVFKDYKHRNYEQPTPLLVWTEPDIEGSAFMQWRYSIVLRLKEGVDTALFEQRFKDEIAPRLAVGNFYFSKLRSFEELSQQYADKSGVTNKLRLQYSLAGFALLCVFLGMVGTFWIRCNARRQEIGLRRSMGASRVGIGTQFLMEAWLLVTTAFLLALPIIIHHVHESGLANSTENGNPVYWQNQTVVHFCIVTFITYVILAVIALIGTYIPVVRASKILPGEALRDE